jgi:hypothetical protein
MLRKHLGSAHRGYRRRLTLNHLKEIVEGIRQKNIVVVEKQDVVPACPLESNITGQRPLRMHLKLAD